MDTQGAKLLDPIVTLSIEGETFGIHVTSGNGKGTAVVLESFAMVTGKTLVVFAPHLIGHARANKEKGCARTPPRRYSWIIHV